MSKAIGYLAMTSLTQSFQDLHPFTPCSYLYPVQLSQADSIPQTLTDPALCCGRVVTPLMTSGHSQQEELLVAHPILSCFQIEVTLSLTGTWSECII